LRRYFHLQLRLIVGTISVLFSIAIASPLLAETDFVVPPGRAPQPQVITTGPDHNLWFTENTGLKIGTITAQGVITEYPIPGAQGLCGITTGPDGNMWFTDEFAGFIGHINTSGGSLVIYNLPAGSHPQGIVTGPDSKLWFVDNSVDPQNPANGFRVRSIDTAGNVANYPTGINPAVFDALDYVPGQITVGPDSNLWLTNANASEVGINFVGRITTAGVFTMFPTADTPNGITNGPDGNLWVIENSHVAKISTSGVESPFALTAAGYAGITTGSDGNIWFTEDARVGFVTPTGTVTEYGRARTQSQIYLTSIVSGSNGDLWILSNLNSAGILDFTTSGQLASDYFLPNQGSFPGWSTLGPDGAVWFAQPYSSRIGRIDTNGVITSCPTPQGAQPQGIVTGPDGNLWFVEAGTFNIAKMTTQCAITEYSVGQTFPGLWEIAVGPDGNLWFTEYAAAYNNIVRITTDGVMTPFPVPTPSATPLYQTSGPDGNVWFTENGAQKIANVNPTTGQITEYPYPGNNKPPEAIVTGPDQNLWIMIGTAYGAIAKFSTSGTLLGEFPAQFQTLNDLSVGSDGAIWFEPYYPNYVGRITTAGVVSTVPLSAPNAETGTPTFGADRKIWISLGAAGAIGRLSAIGGTVNPITASAGSPFNSAVARFVDGTPTAAQADFTSTIDWGDGTGPSTGTVSGPTGGPFTVTGSHTYTASGTYAVNVSLHEMVDNSAYQASPGWAEVTSNQLNYVLTASINGSGTVSSTDGEISCPGTCGNSYPINTPVTLNATSTLGWSFAGWSGACSGTGSCNVTLTQNLSVTARFTQSPGFFNLTVATAGSGVVTSTDGDIDCPGICSHTYPANTPVTLNATPAQGGTFSGWSGACSGTGSCNLAMTQNLSAAATFIGAQQDMVTHSFGRGDDGQNPFANLVFDSAGNLYGTTSGGGMNGKGTVFELSPVGTETILHTFGNGTDGQTPLGSLIFDSAGNLYGTASAGGTHGNGMVFELSPNGTETVLYNFGSGGDGQNPNAGLVFDSFGNLYGTTVNGGANAGGTVFELSLNGAGGWTEAVVYSFGNSPGDGVNPYAGLVLDSSGNLYGTTANGGANASGTAFEMLLSNGRCCREGPVYSFGSGTDGRNPRADLVFDSSGNLYGTTVNGGANGGGTAFELSLNNGGGFTETGLYSFGNGGADGLNPYSKLVFDSFGNLYGTTANGGSYSGGTLFELSPSNGRCCREAPVYSFGIGTDGRNPHSGVIFNTFGGLYGTTVSGGVFGGGTVFGITPAPSPTQFVPVAPCRVVDTRSSSGTFGGPSLPGGAFRSFPIAQGVCNIPSTATGYSLNATLVPIQNHPVAYMTIWPTGQNQPVVSTMNSLDGRIKANAAIVPAGTNTAVSVYVTDTTNIVLDIDGYFAPSETSTLQFYPLTPCRVLDTRNPNGDLGGPYLQGGQPRSFPLLESSCNIPSSAQAYSLNFTVVPYHDQSLGYLTVWPTGGSQPLVSTLNNLTATIVANAAIVPAGTNGDISVYASNNTQLVTDINGYFAAPGQGGLSLYPTIPCRVIDTRKIGSGQPFSGTLTPPVDVMDSACGISSSAAGYVFNATVVPSPSLSYLTLWPDSEGQPLVSTLNAADGWITSNMAIVPTENGKIDAYAAGMTQMILDISAYFAP
jgi:uncharacterized repeat protein (TIGR03803 family)